MGGRLSRTAARDHLHHTFDITEHIVVPEAKHAIAALFQIRLFACIARDAACFVVLAAVEFNHQRAA